MVGGLTGNVAGAAGAAASTAGSPLLLDALANAGLDPDLARGLTALASTALGAAVGGGTGAMTAFNEVSNNFLNHQQQRQYAQALTACRTDTDCQRRVHDQYQGLSNQNNQALAKAQAQCDKTGQCDERDRLYASGVAWGDGLKQVQAATDPEAALVNPVLERVNAKQVQALINRPLQQEVVRLGPVTSFDAQGNVSIDPPRFVAAVDNRNAVTSMGVALAPTLLLPGPEDLVVGAALATKAGQKIAEVVMQGGQKVWRFVDGSTARVGSQEAEQIARARVENNLTRDGSDYHAYTWQNLKGQTDAVRKQLPDMVDAKTGKPMGNAAAAEIHVHGEGSMQVQAHSRVGNDAASAREGFVSLPAPDERILKALPDPKGLPREVDTEYKILESFAQQHKANPQVQGSINLFTERPPCDSCTDVIKRQFTQLYPNVEVRLYHNNGEITVFKGSDPITGKVPSRNEARWPTSPDLPKPPAQKKGR